MPKKPQKTKIKAVLFDLGKVLLHFDFTPAFRKLSKRGNASARDIEAYFVQSGLEVLYDGGRISSSAFYRSVKKALGLRVSYRQFRLIWNHIFTPVTPMIALVSALRKRGFRLVLVSNTNPMHFEFAKKKYAVLRKFHHCIVSYKEKVRKPDERIYRAAIRACRAKPHEIFYIDDRQDLTEAAQEIGLNVFTYKNDFDELKQALKKVRLL